MSESSKNLVAAKGYYFSGQSYYFSFGYFSMSNCTVLNS